jgi:hypothetical protein
MFLFPFVSLWKLITYFYPLTNVLLESPSPPSPPTPPFPLPPPPDVALAEECPSGLRGMRFAENTVGE